MWNVMTIIRCSIFEISASLSRKRKYRCLSFGSANDCYFSRCAVYPCRRRILPYEKGVENSYHSPDEINLLDQKRKEKYLEDRKGLKDLLSIRKEYREFRLTNVFEIEKRVHFMQELSNDHVFCYLLEGIDYTLTVCIKNTTDPFSFYLPQAQMIFNGRRKVTWQEECYHLDQIGVYIFKESKEWKL